MSARVLLTTLAFATLASAVAFTAGRAGPPFAPSTLHTQLISSVPGKDDTLTVRPERIRLLFSGPVQASLSSIEVSGQQGEINLDVEEDPDTLNGLVSELPELPSGSYRVSWRTVSADGHAVSGSFGFTLALPAPQPSAADEGPGDGAVSETETPPDAASEGEGSSPGVAAALRGLADGFLLALAGLALFLGWLTSGAGSRPERLARFFAWMTPVALLLALGAWVVSVVPGAIRIGSMAAALNTLPGRLGTIQVALALLALGAVTAMRSMRVAAVLSLAAVLVGSGVGHAATFQPLWSIPSKAIHLVAASIWLGGLILLLTDESEGQAFADQAGVVSSAALLAVIAIAVTGAVQTLLMVPELGLLIGSDWGTLLILKVIGLLVLVGFGAYHRLRVLPRLAAQGGPSLRASVRWETLVMLAVVITAAFLSRIKPPEADTVRADAVAGQLPDH